MADEESPHTSKLKPKHRKHPRDASNGATELGLPQPEQVEVKPTQQKKKKKKKKKRSSEEAGEDVPDVIGDAGVNGEESGKEKKKKRKRREGVHENGGDAASSSGRFTVSMAVAGSIVDNAQSLALASRVCVCGFLR
jgi:hypothetical protein